MALVFCDGFDSYTATADLTKKWRVAQSPWTWSATAGSMGGGGIVAATTGGGQLATQPYLSSSTLSAVGFYFKASGPPASTLSLLAGYNTGNSIGMEMRLLSTGLFQIWDQGATASLPLAVNICDGNWHWIEFADVNASAGNNTFSVYVDGVSCGSTVIFGGSFTYAYWQFTSIAGITITIDDFITWDLNASPFTAFPLGPRQIATIRPVSDGACTFGTVVGAGLHSSAVNEVTPDGDASYVQDGRSGDQDLYNYGALGYTPGSISGVMLNSYLENPNVGSINFQGACASGATTSLGTPTLSPSVYQTLQTPYVNDPNTSAAWTVAGLNAAQFGIKVP